MRLPARATLTEIATALHTDEPPATRHKPARAPVVYLAIVLAAWALEAAGAERAWPGVPLTYAPQWPWAIPFPILLALALIRRDNRALACCLASAAVLTFPMNNLALPLHRAKATAGLRLMTFNIDGGAMGVSLVTNAIRAANPDVLCLEECKAQFGNPDPLPDLRTAFPAYSFKRTGGIVVASRLPVTSIRVRDYNDDRVWRKALDVRINVRGRVIRVIAVHFITGRVNRHSAMPDLWMDSGQTRITQAGDVSTWVRETSLPTLVAGDFNTPPRGLAYARLHSGTRNAFDDAGLGFGWTYPASHPMLRIDHVFTANGVGTIAARVGPSGASDHRALICDFRLSH